MNNKLLIMFVLLCVFVVSVVNTEACEVCEDVVNTFELPEVELGETNIITLKGHDSHGLRSLSIECTLLCGKETQPCCYDESQLDHWQCEYDYLYCDANNENGICRGDANPPIVSVIATPSDAVPSGSECTSFIDVSATAIVGCDDNGESGCDENTYVLSITTTDPGSCETNYNLTVIQIVNLALEGWIILFIQIRL